MEFGFEHLAAPFVGGLHQLLELRQREIEKLRPFNQPKALDIGVRVNPVAWRGMARVAPIRGWDQRNLLILPVCLAAMSGAPLYFADQ